MKKFIFVVTLIFFIFLWLIFLNISSDIVADNNYIKLLLVWATLSSLLMTFPFTSIMSKYQCKIFNSGGGGAIIFLLILLIWPIFIYPGNLFLALVFLFIILSLVVLNLLDMLFPPIRLKYILKDFSVKLKSSYYNISTEVVLVTDKGIIKKRGLPDEIGITLSRIKKNKEFEIIYTRLFNRIIEVKVSRKNLKKRKVTDIRMLALE